MIGMFSVLAAFGNNSDTESEASSTGEAASVPVTAAPNATESPSEIYEPPLIRRAPKPELLPPEATDVCTSWIYQLRKDALIHQAIKFRLDSSGTVDMLRKRLIQFVRDGKVTPQPTSEPFQFPSAIPIPTISLFTTTTATVTTATSTGYSTKRDRFDPVSSVTTATYPPLTSAYTTSINADMTVSMPPALTEPNKTLENLHVKRASLDHIPPRSVSIRESCSVQPDVTPTSLRVEKWKVSFNGHEDPVAFLERLEEICVSKNIDTDRLLRHMPDLLTDDVSLWFRNNKRYWPDWKTFTAAEL